LKSADANIAIRVDATELMGSGHFMRCLALANEIHRHGGRVRFVGRQPAHMRELAAGYGHDVLTLGGCADAAGPDDLPHSHWLGTSQAADAELTIGALGGRRVEWLVVDHYALDARWESALRQCAARILAIDDLADRPHDCDILLDQNLHDDMDRRYASKVSAGCTLLLGPGFALLRDEFVRERQNPRTRDGSVRRILVLMGGMDTEGLTARAVEAVSRLGDAPAVDVIVGKDTPGHEALAAACARRGYTLHVQPSSVAALMGKADLAVGAGGSTSWERCCLGLPAVVISVADNQEPIAAALDRSGAAFYLGRSSSVSPEAISRKLEDLMARPEDVARAASLGTQLVDGLGTTKVAHAMGVLA
jgi:UDP-2,4-diacetamido-2,4,6-trideoxy-beta-L-altropyranose hydrolase